MHPSSTAVPSNPLRIATLVLAAAATLSVSPAPAAGQDSETEESAESETSESEAADALDYEPAADPGPAEVDRGSVGAEIGASILGAGVGGLGLGTAVLFSTAGMQNRDAALVASGITTGLGSMAGAGAGAYLAGNATGGTGRLGKTMEGAFGVGLGTATGLGLLGLGLGASGSFAGIALIFAAPFAGVIGGMVGSVVAYRKSARPTESATAARPLRLRPILTPPAGRNGGLYGVSVDF